MIKNYKIAEHVIEICSLYENVHNYCKDYLTKEPAEFSVIISQEDIELERQKSNQEFLYEGLKLPNFSDAELEVTAVYRKIAVKMLDYHTFVFHGSVISVDGQAFLFTAKSGTGKSTHTRLWRELLGERAVMVNDDKPLIQVGETVTVFGTPYNGKHRLGCNMSAPLKAICILTRAEENHIERITKSEAYTMLLQQVYRPQDSVRMMQTLTLIDMLAEKVELYRLGCNMDISAAKLAYHTMKG